MTHTRFIIEIGRKFAPAISAFFANLARFSTSNVSDFMRVSGLLLEDGICCCCCFSKRAAVLLSVGMGFEMTRISSDEIFSESFSRS